MSDPRANSPEDVGFIPQNRPARADAAPTGSAPSPAGPLERFEDLARAYRADTGRWPFGYSLDEMKPGEAVDASMGPWAAWLKERNARAATPKKACPPKGQMGLFG